MQLNFSSTYIVCVCMCVCVCVCVCVYVCVCVKPLQLCPTLCEPMDHSPSGSSVHGIIQARILKNGLPCPSPGVLPDAGIKPTSLVSPVLASRFFTTNATRETTQLHTSR